MTYGWAILIVVVALVIVWQWGLFEPKNVKPGSSGFWGVVPEDFSFNADGQLQVSLKNEVGASINITGVYAKVGEEEYNTGDVDYDVVPGGRKLLDPLYTFSEAKMPARSRFEISLWIDYQDSRIEETYRSSGKIWGSVDAA